MPVEVFTDTRAAFKGAFRSDTSRLTFANLGTAQDVGTLVQSFQLGFQQAIMRLFEIGSTNFYYVAGRAQGSGSLQRVIGPQKLLMAFYERYGKICNAARNDIVFSGRFQCETDNGQEGANGSIKARNVVLNSIAYNMTAQDMLIGESSSFIFAALELSEAGE